VVFLSIAIHAPLFLHEIDRERGQKGASQEDAARGWNLWGGE